MSTLARFLLIVLLAGIGPLLAQNGGRTDSSRAASTIDNTPPGTLNPEPLPPLANPNASNLPAKELFARKVTRAAWSGPPNRFLRQRVPCRRCHATDHGANLAGDAAFARPELGNASARQLHQAARR